MRALAILTTGVLLVGCDIFDGELTPEDFNDEFSERFCEEWAACNPDFACSATTTDTTTEIDWDCEFDPEAGQECLDAEWTCNTDSTAFPFVELAPSCLEVYQCEAVVTTTTTTTYTD